MPNAYTYRLAVHPDSGDHGYEIGTVASEDVMNPDAFHVVERVYGQQEAAARAVWWNANPADTHPPDESGEGQATESAEDDDEHPHRRSSRKR